MGSCKGHDGAISVYSVPGKGPTFSMYFRLSKRKPKQSPLKRVFRLRRRAVLYVDDEDALVLACHPYAATPWLSNRGYSSPLEALQAFRSRPDAFDVGLRIWSMPGLTGFDLARSLLEPRPMFR